MTIIDILAPTDIIIAAGFYVVLLLVSAILIIKSEEGMTKIVWLAFILIFPFVASILYLLNYIFSKK